MVSLRTSGPVPPLAAGGAWPPNGLRWVTSNCTIEDSVWPHGIFGPFLPVDRDDLMGFQDSLSDEIDSSFSSSFCCCDKCYDDFAELWPGVVFRDLEFQTQSSETLWLVDYSRLPGVYSPAEISTLRLLVSCPRCGTVNPPNLWIYEHRFGGGLQFESDIYRVSRLGDITPFLMLEDPFARRVLDAIRTIAAVSQPLAVSPSFYRARLQSDLDALGQSPTSLETYGPAPASKVGEGRFNHAGLPMLYLADRETLAAAELGRPGENCVVGELRLTRSLRILDLCEPAEQGPDADLFQALSNSALIAAPRTGEGWVKRQYVFSRFVADCARSAGFDAVRYGSTRAIEGSNYVLLAPSSETGREFELVGHSLVEGPRPAHRL